MAADDDVRVWAPLAQAVHIEIGPPGSASTRTLMRPGSDGWWSWREDGSRPDPFDYAFVVDGAGPFPDPRSGWQPYGVGGPSRLLDPATFTWTDSDWSGPQAGRGTLGGVLYELHIGTFTAEGTLDAAIARLGHLVDLGVDVVELMPVGAFPGRWGWGYDGVLPYAVHEPYGGPHALNRFVDAAHAHGLGVALDVVPNHLGPSGNHLARFGPYFTTAHVTPWGPAVNLDQPGSAEVRRWLVDCALRWFRDFHLDALRLDAVHALHDESQRHVLEQLAAEVRELQAELGRPLCLIAESDLNDAAMVTAVDDGGRGMDAQWADDVHHALHVTLTGETQGYYADFAGLHDGPPPDDSRAPSGAVEGVAGGPLAVLAQTLTGVFLHDGRWSSFRGGPWGRPVDRDAVPGRRFVAYLQTHDQVGNRATGDRITDELSQGRHAIGAALYLLSPFTPMIFMGEEWATSAPFLFFTDFDDPDVAAAVSTGRRREFAAFGWRPGDVPDPQARATRDASVLRWPELDNLPYAAVLRFYRTLTRVRRTEPSLRNDSLAAVEVTFDEDGRWLVMRRGDIVVAVNLADESRDVPLDGTPEEVLAGWGDHEGRQGGIRLGGESVAVVRLGRTT